MLRRHEPPLRDLVAQLVEAGRTYVRAEADYVRQLVVGRASAVAVGVGFAIAGLLFLQAALTVLVVALGMALARWLGFAGGFAVAALIGLAIAGLLAWIGVRRITAAGAGS